MKSALDPRHKKRRIAVRELFSYSFTPQKLGKLSGSVITQKNFIDAKIQQSAQEWPIDKLNKIDLAILRLAVYELFFSNTPRKVVIDEAVEIAKEFGGENSPAFINGVLGNILKT